MKHRSIVWCAAFIVATCGAAPASAPSTKEADIRRLMDMVGTSKLGTQIAGKRSQAMFRALRSSTPDVSDRAAQVIRREMVSFFSSKMTEPGGLNDQLVAIYDRYFTHQEIQDLIAFYATPTGKKAVVAWPQILNECTDSGVEWEEALAPEAETRVKTALREEKLIPTAN